jgi:hypothetical protein
MNVSFKGNHLLIFPKGMDQAKLEESFYRAVINDASGHCLVASIDDKDHNKILLLDGKEYTDYVRISELSYKALKDKNTGDKKMQKEYVYNTIQKAYAQNAIVIDMIENWKNFSYIA